MKTFLIQYEILYNDFHCIFQQHALSQFVIDLTNLNVGSWRRTKDKLSSCVNLTLNVFSRECEHSSHTHCEGTVMVCWKFKLHDGVSVGDISEWVSFTKAFLYLNTFLYLKLISNAFCLLLLLATRLWLQYLLWWGFATVTASCLACSQMMSECRWCLRCSQNNSTYSKRNRFIWNNWRTY